MERTASSPRLQALLFGPPPLTFPLAVWWGPTRIVWLAAGVVFHLGTAFWLGIVDMAFAFLVFYLLWFPEEGVAWMMRSLRITSTANTT